jgi:hypothetical protein
MDFSKSSNTGVGKHGAPFAVVSQFQSWFGVHPDHVGFVIGAKGATVKKIASDCKCYIKIQDPNAFSGGFPWFVIKGSSEANVCEAYHRIRTIANEAERRMPRLTCSVPDGSAPRPRAKLNIKVPSPQPISPVPEPEQVEVTVVEKVDNDGNTVLVNETTNEVYSADGMLVGHFVNGVVMARSDASE